jgi:hypothetical protein
MTMALDGVKHAIRQLENVNDAGRHTKDAVNIRDSIEALLKDLRELYTKVKL